MTIGWQSAVEHFLPGLEFTEPRSAYLAVARLVVDKTFDTSVRILPSAPSGIISSGIAELLGNSLTDAELHAKIIMAHTLGEASLAVDTEDQTAACLWDMLEEQASRDPE